MATDHALRLGKLLGNLQSLEVLLRIYLLKSTEAMPTKRIPPKPYWDLKVGDSIDEDEFSNYDSLKTLVRKYNLDVAAKEPTLAVDVRVVEVRDLLAHGRVAATAEDTKAMKILKFDKPRSGRAVVSASVLMDDGWFDSNITHCIAQIQSVHCAIRGLTS